MRIRLLWQPQLLARKKQHTSILSSGTKVLTGTAGATFGAGKAVVGGGAAIAGEGLNLGTKVVGGGISAGGKVVGGGISAGGKVIGGGGKAIGSVFGLRRQSKRDFKSDTDNGNVIMDTGTSVGAIPNNQSSSSATSDGGLHSNRNSMEPMASGEMTESAGANGTLEVQILSARGLRGVDKSGTSDPYVRVKVGKDSSNKTKHIKKTLTPEW